MERRDEDLKTLWYFAYGSNMSPAIFVDRRGMHPLDVGSPGTELEFAL